MATAAQAIDRIEELTGLGAFRAARFLRESSVSLWPQGSPGRGQEAHVTAHHLVNLVLAMAASDPLSAAPEVVAELRALMPAGPPDGPRLLPAGALGEALDLYVAQLATPSQARGDAAQDWCQITLFHGRPQFSARVYGTKFPAGGVYYHYLPAGIAETGDIRAGLLQKEATIKHQLIVELADLYADTLEHRAKSLAKTKSQMERRPSARKTAAHA